MSAWLLQKQQFPERIYDWPALAIPFEHRGKRREGGRKMGRRKGKRRRENTSGEGKRERRRRRRREVGERRIERERKD